MSDDARDMHGLGGENRPLRINTGCRFDPDLHAALQVAASDREVSFNWIVNRLCREGLERLIPFEEMRLTRTPGGSDA